MDYVVGLASQKDVDEIISLWNKSVEYHKTLHPEDFKLKSNYREIYRDKLIAMVEDKTSRVIVCKYDGFIVGFLIGIIKTPQSIFQSDRIGVIEILYVEDAYRRFGIGDKLVMDSESWYASEGINNLELNCYIRNDEGLKFWNKRMYLPVSVRLSKHI